MFCLLFLVSVSDHVWFSLVPGRVCVSLRLCICLSSFLITSVCTVKVLDQTLLKEQVILPDIYPSFLCFDVTAFALSTLSVFQPNALSACVVQML